jgi:hypothetical protein
MTQTAFLRALRARVNRHLTLFADAAALEHSLECAYAEQVGNGTVEGAGRVYRLLVRAAARKERRWNKYAAWQATYDRELSARA